jgi:DNA polymerase-3 subunit epsilon
MIDGNIVPMRRALLLDTETQGLDPKVDQVIEVGVCLYDLELACAIESYAALIRADTNPSERINHIPVGALTDAAPPEEVWTRVDQLASRADVIAAHRSEFDRTFVHWAIKAIAHPLDALRDAKWICTKTEFDWPGVGYGKSLTELSLAYGLAVMAAHRALDDVETMARILTRVRQLGHSLPDLFRRATRPKKRFVAMVSYNMRHLAKEAGFVWDSDRKEWTRNMPPEDTENLSFRVVQRDA